MLATIQAAPSTTARVATNLNFVVVGQVRSGSAIVQGTLDKMREAVCHNNLFHISPEVRRQAHESYFGPAPAPDLPTWYVKGETNPFRYLKGHVFDQNLRDERVVGVRLTYDEVDDFQFYDLLHDLCQEGDFAVIHVHRNPVACYVSQQQAQESGIYVLDINESESPSMPSAVRIDPAKLTAFVRRHEAVRGKIAEAVDDMLDITYRQLGRNFNNTMKSVLDFLELPTHLPVAPVTRRLPNREMPKRIENLDEVRRAVPADVQEFLKEGTLQ